MISNCNSRIQVIQKSIICNQLNVKDQRINHFLNPSEMKFNIISHYYIFKNLNHLVYIDSYFKLLAN